MSVGVLLDAFVVRTFLIPALISLFGEHLAADAPGARDEPGPCGRRRRSEGRGVRSQRGRARPAARLQRHKAFLGVFCRRLELDLSAPAADWIDDPRLPPGDTAAAR